MRAWKAATHLTLSPPTSLMFPHRSLDNYRRRECHLGRTFCIEDDSQKVRGRPDVPQAHRTLDIIWAHTNTMDLEWRIFTKSEPYVSTY